MRIGNGNGRFFGGVYQKGLHRFKVYKLAISEVEGEPSHFTRLISLIGLVGVVFWSSRHKLYYVFSSF